ncbi:MAG: hypothetical protein LBL92_02160, partial [Propionibacteriaceae bacterium]|nr:hypothetical protein [Propionibacteriaceae bacterium]
PLTRILDILVQQSGVGMICGYGHITFESAAQDQGLRQITFVARPRQRDLTIQRVIQRSGLRAVAESTTSNVPRRAFGMSTLPVPRRAMASVPHG